MHEGPSGYFGDKSRQTSNGFIWIRVQHTPRKNRKKMTVNFKTGAFRQGRGIEVISSPLGTCFPGAQETHPSNVGLFSGSAPKVLVKEGL